MSASERIKSVLRLALPLIFGGVVLWLIYRGIDMAEVSRVLRAELDYGVLALSLLFGLGANLMRGLRWHLLTKPIVPLGERAPRLINAIGTVLGSYTINMGIPRAGELWRCSEYKRYEQLSFAALLGTLINDRLVDILMLMLILIGCIVLNSSFFISLLENEATISSRILGVVGSPWTYIIGAMLFVGFALLIWFVRQYPEGKLSRLISSVLTGVSSIRQMPSRGLFALYSVLIWAGYFGFFYTSFFAFPFTARLPLEAGVLAFAMSSMSALAPVQAGLGPWHFMVITTLTLYGVSRTDAGAFALIVHTTQTLWITLVGLIAIVALPLINRGYRRQST